MIVDTVMDGILWQDPRRLGTFEAGRSGRVRGIEGSQFVFNAFLLCTRITQARNEKLCAYLFDPMQAPPHK